MRIKRFNENQKYLTEPFDPEELTYVPIESFYDMIDKNCELIADELGLKYMMEHSEIRIAGNTTGVVEPKIFYYFYPLGQKDRRERKTCRFYVNDYNPNIGFELFEEDRIEDIYPDNDMPTWGDVKEYLKNYFDLE